MILGKVITTSTTWYTSLDGLQWIYKSIRIRFAFYSFVLNFCFFFFWSFVYNFIMKWCKWQKQMNSTNSLFVFVRNFKPKFKNEAIALILLTFTNHTHSNHIPLLFFFGSINVDGHSFMIIAILKKNNEINDKK